jgi:hypothetical protein
MFEVPRAKGGGMRKATLADARKGGWYPSPTTILSALAKPGLETWKSEQQCLAVLTAPRNEGESLDDFVHRVLHDEEQHLELSRAGQERGTLVHDDIAKTLCGQQNEALTPESKSAVEWVRDRMGLDKLRCERRVVNSKLGYAGTCDLIGQAIGSKVVVDWKTTSAKKMPTEAWFEHRCQAAAYAQPVAADPYCNEPVRVFVVYLSTVNPGEIAACEVEDWLRYFDAFASLYAVWRAMNEYDPRKIGMTVADSITRQTGGQL